MINNTTKTNKKLAQTINSIERSNVLDELKTIARWMPYREVNYDVKPIDPESGNIVHLEDTSKWRTFQKAKKAAKLVNADGLGFIFGDEYFCITLNGDFSNFYDESSWVMSQFKQFLNSYTEWSDNGRLNVFCRVQEYDSKTSLGSSLQISNGSIHANNMNKYCLVPVPVHHTVILFLLQILQEKLLIFTNCLLSLVKILVTVCKLPILIFAPLSKKLPKSLSSYVIEKELQLSWRTTKYISKKLDLTLNLRNLFDINEIKNSWNSCMVFLMPLVTFKRLLFGNYAMRVLVTNIILILEGLDI